jgi:outer membrane protein assembly factor BamE (lipoprotein component of BamABCDE complex)
MTSRSRIFSISALTIGLLAGLLVATPGCRHPAPPSEQPEKLTVGRVQGEIKVGMSAASVAEILGSPNIVTTDEERREVWIYDKVSTENVDTSNSVGGTLIILGGQSAQRQRSRTQKTLTIIIKYDENKLVRDFAYNFSQF